MTTDHTYNIVELVGSSQEGFQQAIDNSITRAAQTLHNLDWFEVREVRGTVNDGKVGSYQVKIGIGFRVLDSADLHRE